MFHILYLVYVLCWYICNLVGVIYRYAIVFTLDFVACLKGKSILKIFAKDIRHNNLLKFNLFTVSWTGFHDGISQISPK